MLRALRGTNGSEVFTVTDAAYRISTTSSIAAGDIDGDGRPEIIACDDSGARLIAFEHDGTFKWRSPSLEAIYWGAPALADLDQDGTPEIIIGRQVLNANGTLRWTGTGGRGNSGSGPISVVADIDLDGKPEVVAGNTAYRVDGTILWQAAVPDGHDAIGNFDDDPYPEIVVVAGGAIRLLENTGQVQWGPVSILGGGNGGPPTVADFDNDGQPEVGVAGASRYAVLETNGTLKWASATQDGSSNVTGSSVFDFEGDGAAEVVYRDELKLRIYDGKTGTVRFETPMSSCTWHEYVQVADVDADGNAEIIAVANNNCGYGPQRGVYVFGSASDSWAGTRAIWNQHSYHITNINDDGTIPRVEQNSWQTYNSYRLNTLPAGGTDPLAAPNLVSAYVRITDSATQTSITARVGNGGAILAAAGVKVAFYDADPAAGGVLLGVATTSKALQPGQYEDLTISIAKRTLTDVWVNADDDGTRAGRVSECDEIDNLYHYHRAGKGTTTGGKFNDLDGDGQQDGRNLLLNFDFEDGKSGFRSDLIEAYSLGPPGVFAIGTSPSNHHGAWASFGDHTSGSGLMMIINGAVQSNHVVWEQQVAVTPGVEYRFGVWAASSHPASPAKIQFYVNGQMIGVDLQLSDVVGQWQYLSATWRADAAGVSTVSLHNYTDAFGGNDFVLDDIEFSSTGIPEPELPGWLVYLDLDEDGLRCVSEPFTFTDVDGNYTFSDLTAGTYIVREEQQAGWRQTAPTSGAHIVTLAAGQVVTGKDFGNTADPGVNRDPRFTSTPILTIDRGQLYRYDALATDLDNDTLTFDLPVAPDGMAVDPTRGVVVWRPSVDQIGSHDVVLRVRDGRGGVAIQPFTIVVSDANHVPVITSTPPAPAVAGLPYRYEVRAQDADGDHITFSLTTPPAGMSIDADTGVLFWTPTAVQIAVHDIIVSVSDGRGGASIQRFNLPVVATAPNDDPSITSTPRTSVRFGATYIYDADASDPNGDVLSYALVDKPAGMTIDPATGVISWTPEGDDLNASFPVTVKVSDGRGGSDEQGFLLRVTDSASNAAPSIISSPALAATLNAAYAYDALASDGDGDPVTWSLITAPRGMSIDPAAGTVRWTPDATQLGPQQVVLRASDPFGATAEQSFTITVRSSNLPPQVLSTPLTIANVGEVYTYGVRAIDPEGQAVSFALGVAPAGMTIDATGLIRWTPLAGQVGSQNVRIEARDPQGALATQFYTMLVSDAVRNRPPSITSTPNLKAKPASAYVYDVNALDPDGDSLTFTLLGSPTGMTIDAATGLITWTPSESDAGSHVITVVVTDPLGLGATQRFTLVVKSNTPPAFVSTPLTSAVAGLGYAYDARATDADGDGLTYSLQQSPAGMSIDPVLGRITWLTVLSDAGSYSIVIAVSDGIASITQSFTLIVGADQQAPDVALSIIQGPNLLLGNEVVVNLGSPLILGVDATDNVGVLSRSLSYGGGNLALDSAGRTLFTADQAGVFTLTATASDAAGNAGTKVRTLRVIDPLDKQPPTVLITSPIPGSQVGGLVNILGDAFDPDGQFHHYELGYALVSEVDPNNLGYGNYTLIEYSTSEVHAGLLGQLDTTLLRNDSYLIRLMGFDAAGNGWASGVIVELASQLKLGNFRLDFTDLSIPVAGIPITITRTYDTLDASRQGDFGYGWSLGIADGDIRETLPDTGSDMFSATPMKVGTRVYITTPDGRRVGFTFEPVPYQAGFIGTTYKPVFKADPGVYEKLEVIGSDGAFSINSAGEARIFMFGFAWNPNDYVLTTKDGLKYNFNQYSGLQSVTDLSGNTLTFSSSGITHSSGQSIQFQRDPKGRIVRIIDPAGNALQYQYDAAGDLARFIDQAGNATTFKYLSTPAHYLDEIRDPLGRRAAKTIYGDDGRVKEVIDANGNSVKQDFDLSAFSGTQTDANGNITTLFYNDRGNVTRKVDPEGGTTLYEYADPANPDKETRVTDPNGHPTTNVYDARGNVIQTTDANGGITLNQYDSGNRLTKTTDALGRVKTFTYTTGGLLSRLVNAAGDDVTMTYDSAGRMTQMSDFAGNVTKFEYTGSGSQPTKVINPDNTFKTFEYNHFGQVTRQTDERGITNTFVYDGLGRLIEERNHLNEKTIRTYDAANNLIKLTDPLGHFTTYEYDSANRLIRQTDTEGGIVEFTYDAQGNRTSLKDPVGNVTRWVYDDNNRMVEEIDPLNHSRFFEYDDAGNQTKITDRNNRVRTFAYDNLKRLVDEKWYEADGTLVNTITHIYDAVGNQLSIADASSKYTYTYDALNRVTTEDNAGSPLLAQGYPHVVFTYAYDANGNRTQVKDNAGVTEDSVYDSRNRLVTRTWQGGGIDDARVDFTYCTCSVRIGMKRYSDLAGTQLVAETKYRYDNAYRVTDIQHLKPDGTFLARFQYTYDAAGRVTSQTTLDDSVTYTYDKTNQLLTADHTNAAMPDEYYSYDKNGNRISSHLHGSGYVTGPGNQLLSDGTYNYEYDAEGNMVKKTNIATGNVTVFEYDQRNRLVLVRESTSAGVIVAEESYTYAADGRRLAVTTNGATVYTVPLDQNVWILAETVGGSVTTYGFSNHIDDPLVLFGDIHRQDWILSDKLGSVIGGVDQTSSIVAYASYNSYGQVLVRSSPERIGSLAFAGRPDGLAALFYNRARYLDSAVGRFISTDPLGFDAHDTNLFRYAGNRPLDATDPLGTSALVNQALLYTALFGAILGTVSFTVCKIAIGQAQDLTITSVVKAGVFGAIGAAGFKLATTAAIIGLVNAGATVSFTPVIQGGFATIVFAGKVHFAKCTFLEFLGGGF